MIFIKSCPRGYFDVRRTLSSPTSSGYGAIEVILLSSLSLFSSILLFSPVPLPNISYILVSFIVFLHFVFASRVCFAGEVTITLLRKSQGDATQDRQHVPELHVYGGRVRDRTCAQSPEMNLELIPKHKYEHSFLLTFII